MTDQEEVGYVFEQYDLISAPVVGTDGRLLGVVTVDDVVDVIQEEAEEDILRLSGVAETDIYRAALKTMWGRFTWLLINLGTAILASFVIYQFDGTIDSNISFDMWLDEREQLKLSYPYTKNIIDEVVKYIEFLKQKPS